MCNFSLVSAPPTVHSDHGCQSQQVRSCGERLAAEPHCARCAEEVSDLGKHTLPSSSKGPLLTQPRAVFVTAKQLLNAPTQVLDHSDE